MDVGVKTETFFPIQLTKEEELEINKWLLQKGLPTNIGVTFADVSLPESYSDVRSRSEIQDFSSRLVGDTLLNIPIISANMESVTGAELASALAREGGIGCLPQMIPLADRVEMLRRVRRTDGAFIEDPLTIVPDAKLAQAKEVMKRFGVSSLVVVNGHDEPLGILSKRDWKYETDDNTQVSRLMSSRELVFAFAGTTFDDARRILRENRIEKLPLVDKDGKLAGLMTAHGLFYEMKNPRALRCEKGKFLVVGSIGVGRKFQPHHLHEVEVQVKEGATAILIDTARAQSINASEALTEVKKHFPRLPVIIGNVCTPQGVKFLFENGADCVKVNQGRGHVCRTSEVGVGTPQLTAIAKCSVIAKKYGGTIIADGGMKSAGDMMKAIVAGADSLMTGYTLVDTLESSATMYLNRDGLPVKNYEGSASFQAQAKRIERGNLDRLRRPEGVTEEVSVTGTIADKIADILDAFRSAMSYMGVRTLDEARVRGKFEAQTNAGWNEGTKKNSDN